MKLLKKQTFSQQYLKKSFMNNYINQEKKISSKRNINYQDDRSPISNKLKINDSFYFEFKKKFKENNENDKNLSNINIKTTKNKKHLFTKPGFKKEISQGNLLSRNFFDGKKEKHKKEISEKDEKIKGKEELLKKEKEKYIKELNAKEQQLKSEKDKYTKELLKKDEKIKMQDELMKLESEKYSKIIKENEEKLKNQIKY